MLRCVRKTQHHGIAGPSDNHAMSETIIPLSIYVPCPEIGFRARSASKCVACPHFDGIDDVVPKPLGTESFEQRFRVRCRHVIARRVMRIEVENAGAD